MNNQNIEDEIAELRGRAKNYIKELEFNVLGKANLIVEVGALTVGTDSSGKIIAQNVLYPTQFSQNAVAAILKMCWRNGDGEIIVPIVYGRNDWYRERLKRTNEITKLFIDGNLANTCSEEN